jgi:formylglycine-generating enzyme required for sulfatase activity
MMAPVHSYDPNPYGLYNMNGNIAEMVTDSSIAVGGCWNSPGYDVRNESVMPFDKPSIFVGFRPVVFVSRR